MYFSIRGTITFLLDTSIAINVNDINYEVFVSNPNKYKIGEIKTIFLHLYSNDIEEYLIGFNDLKEKKIFLSLISVRGIGPKTALNIIGNCDIDDLLAAINSSNVHFLKRLPGIGNKSANQIILDLKGRLPSNNNNQYKEIKDALINLGFKNKEVEEVLSKINLFGTKEVILKEALKKLNKQ